MMSLKDDVIREVRVVKNSHSNISKYNEILLIELDKIKVQICSRIVNEHNDAISKVVSPDTEDNNGRRVEKVKKKFKI